MARLASKKTLKRKADALISKIVRSQGYCDWCTATERLQCAHYVGRQNHTLRFDLMNVICLCAGCHRKAHDYPNKFVKWFESKFANRVKYIEMNQNRLTKRTAKDYKELVEGLQDVYDQIEEAGI